MAAVRVWSPKMKALSGQLLCEVTPPTKWTSFASSVPASTGEDAYMALGHLAKCE